MFNVIRFSTIINMAIDEAVEHCSQDVSYGRIDNKLTLNLSKIEATKCVKYFMIETVEELKKFGRVIIVDGCLPEFRWVACGTINFKYSVGDGYIIGFNNNTDNPGTFMKKMLSHLKNNLKNDYRVTIIDDGNESLHNMDDHYLVNMISKTIGEKFCNAGDYKVEQHYILNDDDVFYKNNPSKKFREMYNSIPPYLFTRVETILRAKNVI